MGYIEKNTQPKQANGSRFRKEEERVEEEAEAEAEARYGMGPGRKTGLGWAGLGWTGTSRKKTGVDQGPGEKGRRRGGG